MNRKILAYGDQHFKLTGSFLPFNQAGKSGISLQLENTVRGCKAVADAIRAHKPKAVINLGDVFHNYDVVSVQALFAAGIGIGIINDACDSLNIPHFIIMGNHDCCSLDPVITSLTVFRSQTCTIITQPEVHIIAGARVGFLPYTKEEVLAEKWNNMRHCDYVFSHNEVKGAQYESGKSSDNGIDLPVGPEIISGHIHLSQVLDGPKVYFPGSLVQDKFTRGTIETFGVAVVDTTDREVTMERNTLSKHYVLCHSVEEVLALDPETVLVKLYSSENREYVSSALASYKYMQVKPPKKNDVATDVAAIEIQKELHEPDTLLKKYVQEAKPEAMELLSDIIGGEQ